ncbi:MAG: ABC transporter permease [Ilumatobacteraceae bacterium]
MSAVHDPELRLVLPRRSIRQHLVDVWRYRELWSRLVRKELHVRYQKSVLGFAWSMANPLFLLVVYTIVFSILGQSFAWFGIWVLVGVLVWNFVSTSLATGAQAITSNGYLVGKVNFPREVLPLASVGAALVHLMLSTGLLVAVLAVTRFQVDWGYLWLTPFAILTMVIMASAFAILLSALNVYARDTTHLLELVLLAWFWLTPIIYPFELVTQKLQNHDAWSYWHLLNPMTSLLIPIQRGVYGKAVIRDADGKVVQRLLPDLSQWWYLRNIGIVFVVSVVLFAVAIKLFDRAEANFAEVI